jgi:CO/xanthine dehydrogenase FAD-binding subunit
MMVVECPDCHTRSFVAAVVDEKQADDARIALRRLAGEHTRIQPAEELTVEEPASPAEPVNEADVEEMRDFLSTFNGDFKRLFAKG